MLVFITENYLCSCLVCLYCGKIIYDAKMDGEKKNYNEVKQSR
jgi:hypothetical protein